MEVFILTITSDFNFNYGNKLQNYAVQEALKKSGYNTVSIRLLKLSYILFFCKIVLLFPLLWALGEERKDRYKKRIKFISFNKKIKQSFSGIKLNNFDTLTRHLFNCNRIIYGSDQIWNPEFDSFTKAYLGICAPREKNIALSASFGVDEIPEQYRDLFRKALLNNFSAISVREYQGAKIIKDLTGMDVEVLPDPTLTLSREKWEALEKPVSVPKEYYLTYFLGNKPEQTISAIDLIQGLSHVSAEPDQPLGPSEFLYLIHRAKYMCTDSFHGCVFSIIYQVPFMLFTRQDSLTSMNSRLTSLFQMLGLKGEQHEGYTFVTKEEISSDIVQDNLKAAVQRFNQFLEKNL